MILLDTNILGRITNGADPLCATCREAIRKLHQQGERLVIVPQNLYEFWAVATRKPENNGLGMEPNRASFWIGYFQRRFIVLPDQEALLPTWHALVKSYTIKSFQAHDVRLVAAMQTYSVTRMLTKNPNHFQRFPITLMDPSVV